MCVPILVSFWACLGGQIWVWSGVCLIIDAASTIGSLPSRQGLLCPWLMGTVPNNYNLINNNRDKKWWINQQFLFSNPFAGSTLSFSTLIFYLFSDASAQTHVTVSLLFPLINFFFILCRRQMTFSSMWYFHIVVLCATEETDALPCSQSSVAFQWTLKLTFLAVIPQFPLCVVLAGTPPTACCCFWWKELA